MYQKVSYFSVITLGKRFIFLCFVDRVGRGNLSVKAFHFYLDISVSHLPSNSGVNASWIQEFNAKCFREHEHIKYFICSSGNWTHNLLSSFYSRDMLCERDCYLDNWAESWKRSVGTLPTALPYSRYHSVNHIQAKILCKFKLKKKTNHLSVHQ